MNYRATSLDMRYPQREDHLRSSTINRLHPSWIQANPTQRTNFPNQYNRRRENHHPYQGAHGHQERHDHFVTLPVVPSNDIIRSLFLKKNIDLGNSQKLGTGRYSKVFTAIQTNTQTMIAMKSINTRKITADFNSKFLPREIECWKRLQHPHLIQVLGHYEAVGYVFLTMEYGPGGDLLRYVQKQGAVPAERSCRWSQQIISGIAYMHSRNIVHRDIKLENVIVFNEWCVKISDFGFARYVQDDLSATYCGSKSYSAPEVLLGEPYNPFKADVWSAGVLIFVMVTDCMPFRENIANERIVDSQRNHCYRYPLNISLSPNCKSLVEGMMTFNWRKRPDILQCFHHDWFKSLQAYIPQ